MSKWTVTVAMVAACGGGGVAATPDAAGTPDASAVDATVCVPQEACGPSQCGDIETCDGETLACGGCDLPETCGGTGHANTCGTPIYVYANERQLDRLLRINYYTEDVEVVGSIGFDEVSELAYAPLTDTLYGLNVGDDFNAADDQLIVIDQETGAGTAIATITDGPINVSCRGLTIDPTTSAIYSVCNSDLATIDPETGELTILGEITSNAFPIAGLAYDGGVAKIFGVDTASDGVSNSLWVFDLDGGGTPIGKDDRLLRGIDSAAGGALIVGVTVDDALVTINKATGLTTPFIADLGFTDVAGIAVK